MELSISWTSKKLWSCGIFEIKKNGRHESYKKLKDYVYLIFFSYIIDKVLCIIGKQMLLLFLFILKD